MDFARFDRLTKSLSAPNSRRTLLRVLSALPLAEGLLLSVESGAARKCKSEPQTKTCKRKCGTVKNNCKKKIDCGSCCTTACPICNTCDDRLRLCIPTNE